MGTLIFDGECGFCTRSRDVLIRLDRRHRVRTVPFQQPGVPEQAGVSEADLRKAVYWLAEDGTRFSGAEAVNAALSAAMGSLIPLRIYRLPGVRTLQDAAYRWVAANRHKLPGTTPLCTSHPENCG